MGLHKGCFKNFYTVYNNRTDELVCLDATAPEAAKAMGVTIKGFYPLVSNTLAGKCDKWHIEITDKAEVIE